MMSFIGSYGYVMEEQHLATDTYLQSMPIIAIHGSFGLWKLLSSSCALHSLGLGICVKDFVTRRYLHFSNLSRKDDRIDGTSNG